MHLLRRATIVAAHLFALLLVPIISARAEGQGDPLLGYVWCYCTAEPGGGASSMLPDRCTISPAGTAPGDRIHVDVVVWNILGDPQPDATVTVTPVYLNGAAQHWCSVPAYQTALSDMEGMAYFVFDRGSVVPHADVFPTLTFDITGQGPGPGGPYPLPPCEQGLSVTSFDIETETTPLDVSIVDFAVAASRWAAGSPGTDFNHDGASSYVIDFAMFGAHLHDVCP